MLIIFQKMELELWILTHQYYKSNLQSNNYNIKNLWITEETDPYLNTNLVLPVLANWTWLITWLVNHH